MEGTMARLAPRDMRKMVPVVMVVIIVVLLLVLRNISASFATLMVVILSTVWTFGLMAKSRMCCVLSTAFRQERRI